MYFQIIIGILLFLTTTIVIGIILRKKISFLEKISPLFPKGFSKILLGEKAKKIEKLILGAVIENQLPIISFGRETTNKLELIEYSFLGMVICFLFDSMIFFFLRYFFKKKAFKEIEKITNSKIIQTPWIQSLFKNFWIVIIIYRFIPMTRMPVLAIGSVYMLSYDFLIFNAIGAVSWVSFYTLWGIFSR